LIGAHKINEHTDDLERLFELFQEGLSNSKISREYRTNSGDSLSRIHISKIRRGHRWNPQRRSFLMKTELENGTIIQTVNNKNVYRTEVGILATQSVFYYVFMDYKNDELQSGSGIHLMDKKPNTDQILQHHKNILNK